MQLKACFCKFTSDSRLDSGSKISIGGGGITPQQIRQWLITALFVFVVLNILLAMVRPFLGIIMAGIVAITVGGMLYERHGHL